MSLINISNLTFGYEGSAVNVFENVSLNIDTSWRLGFTGRNGRGKTTFLRLLEGAYNYSGSISADVDFVYFPYTVSDENTPALYVAYDVLPTAEEWQIRRELKLIGVDDGVLYRPFSTLSQGEKFKILLASLFVNENGFFLIDEPTNHLDIKGREAVADYLAGKNGFILVSHDAALLDACTDHTLSINKTNIEICRGSFSVYLDNKEKQESFELSQNEKLTKEINRLKSTAKEKADWSDKAERRKTGTNPVNMDTKAGWRPYQGAKSKKLMSRAKATEKRIDKAIEEKSSLLRNTEQSGELKLTSAVYRRQNLIKTDKLSVIYDGVRINEPVSFTVDRGEHIALCGENGAGKSSILKAICGAELNTNGSIIKGNDLIISYVCQDMPSSALPVSDFARERSIDVSLLYAVLDRLGFSKASFFSAVDSLSDGERKKLALAVSLCEKAHLYLWDEPLNFLDIYTRRSVSELISGSNAAFVFVEHDRSFCDSVADKQILVKRCSGNKEKLKK